jgi:hypothetical protein
MVTIEVRETVLRVCDHHDYLIKSSTKANPVPNIWSQTSGPDTNQTSHRVLNETLKPGTEPDGGRSFVILTGLMLAILGMSTPIYLPRGSRRVAWF